MHKSLSSGLNSVLIRFISARYILLARRVPRISIMTVLDLRMEVMRMPARPEITNFVFR